MFKIRIFFIFLLLFAVNTFSQEKAAKINFDSTIFYFGEINEVDGNVNHTFIFTNTGNIPLNIYDVRSSCGCVSPKWTKEPVLPGETGSIEVVFNPARWPGPFNKSITVKSNAPEGYTVLRIKGNVIGKPLSVEDKYPYVSGNLRFETNHFAFSDIFHNHPKSLNYGVYNASDEKIKISFDDLPAHIFAISDPEILDSNEEGFIKIAYNPIIKNDWDFVMDKINILQNDKDVENNTFTLSANIIEDFSKMTSEDSLNAPSIFVKEKVHNFGNISKNVKTEFNFEIKNTGKSDLIIRKVHASCGCTIVEPEENIIKPGKTSFVKATFNTENLKGEQSKSITVISNDPINNKVVLKLKCNVQQ